MTQHDEDLAASWRLQEQSLERARTVAPGQRADARDLVLAAALAMESLPPPPSDLVARILAAPRLGRPIVRIRAACLALAVSVATFLGLLAAVIETYAGGIRTMLATMNAVPGSAEFVLAASTVFFLVVLRFAGALTPMGDARAATA